MHKLKPYDVAVSYAGAVAGEHHAFTFTLDYKLVERPLSPQTPMPFHRPPHHPAPLPYGRRQYPIDCREVYVTRPGCRIHGYNLMVQVNGELEIHHVRKVAGHHQGDHLYNTTDHVPGILEDVYIETDADAEYFAQCSLGGKLTMDLVDAFNRICHDDPRVLDAGAYRLDEIEADHIYNARLNTTTIATLTQRNWNLGFELTEDYHRYGYHREVEDDSVYYDAKRRIITPHILTWVK